MLSPRMVALGAWLLLGLGGALGCAPAADSPTDPSVEAALAKKHVAPAPQGGDVFASGPKGSHLPGVHPYASWVSTELARGSQPSDADFAELAQLGFRSVVNLRDEDDSERPTVTSLGMKYMYLPIVDDDVPTVAQAKSFLRFVTTASHLPVFVHCRAGRNRTGVAVAIYEMAVRGMTSDAAITEGEGFGLHVAVEEQFVRDFGDLLAAHSVPGFPLVH